jgi:hypothetical protein
MARHFRSIWSAAFATLLLTAPVAAQPQPDATLDVKGRSVAVGVGSIWGGGMLHYQGQDHPLRIRGVTVIDIGATEFSARGDVFHLQQLNDINGVYHGVAASAAVGAGAGASTLENDKGVQIKMVSSSAGLQLKFAPEGVSIELQ